MRKEMATGTEANKASDRGAGEKRGACRRDKAGTAGLRPDRPASCSAVLSPVEVLVMKMEKWQLCNSVALDPEDSKWSCCRDLYPFHRPTQRCCQTSGIFVIPKNIKKSEAEDCRTYTQQTQVGPGPPTGSFPFGSSCAREPQRSFLRSLLPGSSALCAGACLLLGRGLCH